MVAKLVLGKPQNLDFSLPLRVDLWHNSLRQLLQNSAILRDIVETLIILIMESTQPFYLVQLQTVVFQGSANWLLGT